MDKQPRDTPPHQSASTSSAAAATLPSRASNPPRATNPQAANPPPQDANPPQQDNNQLPNVMANLAQAMTALMAQLQAAPPRAQAHRNRDREPAREHRTHVKARDPDPYDGSDPMKLRAFLSQCKLVFRACPDDFDDDEVKITYAVSWLKGTAQRWYEPNLSLDEEELPDFALNWNDFEEALKTTFGEPDPISTASYKLDHLAMKDHYHITKYIIEFNELAAITGYDERALYSNFYRGLAPRIKDTLAISGKPTTLDELRTKSQALDLRYWERRDKEHYKNPSSSSKTASTSSSSTAQNVNKSQSASTSTKSRSATPADTTKPKTPDLSKILGPDGKLLPAEKDRRRKNNLCLICAAKDHHAEQCPSRRERTQARTATIEEVTSSSDAEASDDPN